MKMILTLQMHEFANEMFRGGFKVSKPKVFEKPSGLKDYLPDAVAKLRFIENSVLECMRRWGYREIITPTLEYYDTVGVASTTSDPKLYKLLDKKGTTLVMRSDTTAPIARVVSSLLKDEPLPIRLSYRANVFRSIEEKAGRQAEFFQAGVELIGDGSAEGDAEVIALAISCLKASGVQQFKLALGHIGFLDGLFKQVIGDNEELQAQLKACLVQRNFVEYRELIDGLALADADKSKLHRVLRLHGTVDVCDQARELSDDQTSHAALDHLIDVWQILEAYGVSERVFIDLTMIGDFSYYTGMTFEGYAADLGFPVCSGGRYDNLLKQFGRPAPAVGFALKTNRILEIVEHTEVEQPERYLIVYEAERRLDALKKATELREQQGVMVETRLIQAESEIDELSDKQSDKQSDKLSDGQSDGLSDKQRAEWAEKLQNRANVKVLKFISDGEGDG